ncbi:ATP-binding protein [Nonomuraea sp. NPDC050663]|uniref:ATP-binding protein n=1 Tax=Nonomuraea sp. NPDC050663 TaxID=3364370 RepID=UPI00378BCCF3
MTTSDLESQDLVVRLPGVPSQVSRARHLVAGALGRGHPLYDDCLLLTSELATNAVLHSRSGDGGGFTLAVHAARGRVRVSIEDDGSAEPPCACRTSLNGTSGRGLPLIESLSHRWGFSRANGCNSVWFELVHVTVPAQWTC